MKSELYRQNIWRRLHIDLPLLVGLLALMTFGSFIIYSASGTNFCND